MSTSRRPLVFTLIALIAVACGAGAYLALRDEGGRDREAPVSPTVAESAAPSAADSRSQRADTAAAPNAVAPSPVADASSPAAAHPIAPPGRADVSFVMKGTREPVAGVSIVFDREPFGPAAPSHRATTDSAGRILLEELPVGRWHARADDDFFFLDPRREFVDVLPEPDPWPTTLTLERGALVTGNVVDRRGAPVEGAEVTLTFDMARRSELEDSASFVHFVHEGRLVATTETDGRFSIRGVPAGAPGLFEVRHSRYAPTEAGGLDARAGEVCPVPAIVLTEGGAVSVRVTTAEGRPVTGAAVYCMRIREAGSTPRWGADATPVATSGADGVATVSRLRPGNYALCVIAGEARPFGRNDIVVEELRTTEVGVTLEAGAALEGIVVDGTGGPVSGASVEVFRTAAWARATSDAAGRFSVAGLAPGVTSVRVSAAGFASASREVAIGPEPARLVLVREATVSGQVVDREGRPVTAFRLFVRPFRDATTRARFGAGAEGATPQSFDVQDPEGRFRAMGLAPATYILEALAAGRGLGFGRVENVIVEEGAAIEGIRIEVESTTRVRARVLDAATREPVEGAIVLYSDESTFASPASDVEWRRVRGQDNVAGDDGTIDVDFPRSAIALRFSAKGYLDAVIEPVPAASAVAAEIEVPLSRGATVYGTVRNGAGLGVANASVEVALGERPMGSASTNELGEYEISGLEPGEYRVAWRSSEKRSGLADAAPVTILGAESVRVDFGPGARPGSHVFGIVLAGGAPVGSAAVSLYQESSAKPDRWVETDEFGRFEFSSVPAGDWGLEARVHSSSAKRIVEIDGESPCSVEILLPSGRLTVTVIAASTREPLEQVQVAVELDGRSFGAKDTRKDGRAEFVHLPIGVVQVQVRGQARSQGRPWRFTPQTIPATIPETGVATLEVALSEGCVLEGIVTGPDGKPAPNPRVTLRPASGREIGSILNDRQMAQGSYRVTGLEPGAYAAIVRAADAAATVFPDVRVTAEGPNRADFALSRGGDLEVRVVGAGGEPIAQASVSCDTVLPGGASITVVEGRTRPDRAAPVFRLAAGAYEVRARSRAAGGASPRQAVATVIVVEGETTAITLTATAEGE